jgi:polyphenol oxidase
MSYPSKKTFFKESPTTSFLTTRHTSLDQEVDTHTPNCSSVIKMNQVHGNDSVIITHSNAKKIHTCDAIITKEKNVLLTVKTADCLPILIYHPSGIIAAIHAGRKGTKKHILRHTLEKIKTICKTNSQFHIWFGPHIHEKEYEINPDTHECYNLQKENKTQLWQSVDKKTSVLIENPSSTVKNNDDFFSYRLEKEKAGRFYSTIMLNN